MRLTVVVPSYNGSEKILNTITRILANEVGQVAVDVLVVDDGSPCPLAPALANIHVAAPFTLHCIRQENAGPGAARNQGFRAARGEIVLFVDDDILAPRDLILRHLEAHAARPGSVICGSWRLAEPERLTPLFRYVSTLGFDGTAGSGDEFVPVGVVASGHLSVERKMFDAGDGVYRDDLATPAAEEYELSCRLHRRGIPILLATRIWAVHDHPVTLESMCRQQFKHGMGCGEAAAKYPETLCLSDVEKIVTANGPVLPHDRAAVKLRKLLRGVASTAAGRKTLLGTARVAERLLPLEQTLPPLYRAAMGAYFVAGVREGLRRTPTRPLTCR